MSCCFLTSSFNGRSQFQLTQLNLDLHFPNAYHTQQQFVSVIFQSGKRGGWKFFWLICPPDKDVSVEQKFHPRPSQKSSGKGSSKSSLVEIVPRLRPATRFFLERATTGTRRATGVPCSVMITSLPANACASKSGNLFWASSTLTVWVIRSILSTPREYSIVKGL